MTDVVKMPKAIAEAVLSVMKEVGYVEKKGQNKFHGYNYAAVGDILAKVQPALVDAGLVILQNEVSHDLIADGALMEARYEFTLAHKASDVVYGPIKHTGLAAAKNSKGGYDDKALNKCHTAARKYFILGVFQIPTGDLPDPDADEDREHHKPATPAPTSRKQEADPIAKAREWANNAHAALAKMKFLNELNVWLDSADNAKKMAYLQKELPDEFTALDDKVNVTADRLNSLVAG